MKRGLLGILPIFFINFVSAQFFSGYNRFSVTDFFASIDPQTMTMAAVFFILFALIFYALAKVFKTPYGEPNKAVAGTIAFAISVLIIYFGLYRTGFSFEGLFYDIGISSGLLYTILPIVVLIAAILIIWKLKIRGFLIISGLLLMLLTVFTDIFYEKGLVFFIGLVLFVVGILLWRSARKGAAALGRGAWGAGKWAASKYDWEREKREAKAIGRGAGWLGRKTWAGTKGLGRGAAATSRYIGDKYDWEKEKRQAAAIGRGVGAVGKGTGWLGRKTKHIAKQQMEEEKRVMQERAEKIREKRISRIWEKAEKIVKKISEIDKRIAELGPTNMILREKYMTDRKKLEKKYTKLRDKMRKLGYPV